MKFLTNLDKIRNKRILVIGDMMLDIYLHGKAIRISPEAPVPIVLADKIEKIPGGAANVVTNLNELGCTVIPMGFIGEDEEGDYLLSILKSLGIATECMIRCPLRTIHKTRVLGNGQHLVRYDFDTNFQAVKERKNLINWISALADISSIDVVIVSDYVKGTICDCVMSMIKKTFSCPIICDTKTSHKKIFSDVFCITPNLMEAKYMHGLDENNPCVIARNLKKEMNLSSIIITMSDKGVLFVDENDKEFHFEACTKINEHDSRQRFDVTGAGDTVISVFSACIAAGLSSVLAVEAANAAAGIVVNKIGTAVCTYNELKEELKKEKYNDRFITPI